MKYANDVYWLGDTPVDCDVCGERLKEQFIDGRRSFDGRWCIFCVECHKEEGVGLGTGNGQLYDLSSGRKLQG